MSNLKYSLEVYDTHAMIKGQCPSNVLISFCDICRDEEGLKYIADTEGNGLMLVKKIRKHDDE